MDKTIDRIARNLICETAPRRVADAAERLGGEEMETIQASLPGALAGNREHVRLYVGAYGRLSERMLEAVEGACPKLLSDAAGHHVATPGAKAVLWGEAMNAPFTYWVGSLGSGRGTAVAMVSLLRQTLPSSKPLSAPSKRLLPNWKLDDAATVRFYRAVSAAF
jgi:hypothetical protein